MMTSRLHHSRQSDDGFIIVAVMWILMALATLASVYAIHVTNSAMALSVNDDRVHIEAIVSAAIELTAYQLSSSVKQNRPTHGAFNFRLDRANVAVEFSSEAARIDLNAAPKELLAGLFAVLGAPNQEVNTYADRIIGWRTPPKRDAQDREDALYRASGLRYSPRGAPFAHVNELWLVQGLPPALVERAMAYVTVFSGKPGVNVLDAAPEVIAALPGMTPGRLNAFLGQRETLPSDPQMIAGALGGPGQTGISTEGSNAIRVNVRINFDKGPQTASEVVILLGAEDAPLRVLSWRDDVDGAPARPANTRAVR